MLFDFLDRMFHQHCNKMTHASAKIEYYYTDDGSISYSEDIIYLQLELDIIKTVLMEEIKNQAEIQVRTIVLGDELKAADLRILEAYRQKEATERELNAARLLMLLNRNRLF